jgi:hypothetical protein
MQETLHFISFSYTHVAGLNRPFSNQNKILNLAAWDKWGLSEIQDLYRKSAGALLAF